jgi:hypothetical protein
VPAGIMIPIREAVIGKYRASNAALKGFVADYLVVQLFSKFFLLSTTIPIYVYSFVYSKCGTDQINKNKHKKRFETIYSVGLRIVIEVSIELWICTIAEITARNVDSLKERVSFWFSLSVFIGLLLFVPIMYRTMSQQYYVIGNPLFPKFNLFFSELWIGLRVSRLSPPVYYLVFLTRRFVFAVILLNMPQVGTPTIFLLV